jgi:hypothetical protein
MPATNTTPGQFTLVLTDQERTELLRLLDQYLRETHVEARRTEAPAWQTAVHSEESILRGLLEKVRRQGAAP